MVLDRSPIEAIDRLLILLAILHYRTVVLDRSPIEASLDPSSETIKILIALWS